MSPTYHKTIPIEDLSLNTIPFIWFAELYLLCVLVKWVAKICECLSRSRFFFESQLGLFDDLKTPVVKKNQDFEESCSSENVEDGDLCKEDVEVVMTRLGIFRNPESEKLQRLGSDDILSLFEEKEPGLDEVKEAFDVFDENRDGFLDAREIQRVLYNLGFKDGLEIERCKRMIDAFDDNGDGRIDFKEFVKLMENMFC
ncbi:Calcium-binding protein CML45 [Actinidia chinensis var. chinensis]|uniref:Calcium-binding protein CML45 n=1 Tax=Actinidia chinensis var. chinensis TaxID=1590841 RepID=A0A2R6RYN0_ACTCC|nr:Calcium-binding protein CML45 [Actinidia chinensis var. chinensis]